MHKIEAFATEQEVVKRIERLKLKGVDENRITLVAKRDLEAGGTFEEYSGVKIKSSDGDAWDKIMAFFTNDEPEEQVADNMDLTVSDEKKFIDALESDKILLHVDEQATVEGRGPDILGGPGAGAVGVKGLSGTGAEGRADLGAAGMTEAMNPSVWDNEVKRNEEDVTSDEELRRLREEENLDDIPKDKK